jgi:hypothetical protein
VSEDSGLQAHPLFLITHVASSCCLTSLSKLVEYSNEVTERGASLAGSLKNPLADLLVEVEFPNLYVRPNQVTLVLDVVRGQSRFSL